MKGGASVLGIQVDPVGYEEAVRRISEAAAERRSFAVSALAVHGVMTGVLDPEHAHRLNHLDLIVPDGQPVRWMLNARHGARLADRCYGPELMLRVCAEAARRDWSVALVGSTAETLDRLERRLKDRFPRLSVALKRPSMFRPLSADEADQLVTEVNESGARIAMIGLGCPRQETFVFENRGAIHMPMLAVGAAFDFHAGGLAQAPPALQRVGLEWAYRLSREPTRLWKRYLGLNPLYTAGALLQLLRVPRWDRPTEGVPPRHPSRFG